MAAFSAAVAFGGEVFLADPSWGAAERAALDGLLPAESGPGGRAAAKGMASRPVPSQDGGGGWLMIPSGGTTGTLRFARHDEGTISAAVRGFAGCFGVERVNSVGVLPLHHVSGLMAWMRAALTGGTHLPWDWKLLEAGMFPDLAAGSWFLSLVPTQLQRLLGSPETVAWLRGLRAILVGGGPVWPALSSAAAAARLPISLTYGATETAAMATALPPEEFLSGGRSSGVALPHARVRLAEDGAICVGGESIFRGYYPDWEVGAPASRREFVTGDLGRLDGRGRLTVVGRKDAVIITGGEKVDPQEVEAALWASGEYSDVAVIGIPDPEWGEAVVACYPAGERPPDLSRTAARGCDLAAYKRPRRFLAVADWPRNAQGKVNRAALRAAIRI
jgi:O-succinylbenzoic acid--CoA ligase